MKNPYDRLFSSEHEDDDTDSDSSSPAKKTTKPLIVNDSILNISLNKQKEQQNQNQAAEMLRAELEAASPTNEYKGGEDDEDEEDSDSSSVKPRRRAARSIRTMLKHRRSQRPATETPNTTIAEPVPETPGAGSTGSAKADKRTDIPAASHEPVTEVEVFLHDEDPEIHPLGELNGEGSSRTSQPEAGEATTSSANRIQGANLPPPIPPPLNVAAFSPELTAANTIAAAAAAGAGAAAANLNQAPAPVIERRNNLAGPFVAFLAANYLSKRRDRKIRREAKKTDKELQATQDRVRGDSRRTGRLEEVMAAIKRQPRPPDAAEAVRSTPEVPPTHPNMPVPVAAVLATSDRLAKAKTAPRGSQQEKPPVPAPETAAPDQEQRRSAAELLQLRQVARQEAAELMKESDFDRRHEVKDSPATKQGPANKTASLPGASAPVQQAPSNTSSQPAAPAAPTGTGQPPAAPGTDLYKQSIRAGFLAGIAVVVLGFIAVIIL